MENTSHPGVMSAAPDVVKKIKSETADQCLNVVFLKVFKAEHLNCVCTNIFHLTGNFDT